MRGNNSQLHEIFKVVLIMVQILKNFIVVKIKARNSILNSIFTVTVSASGIFPGRRLVELQGLITVSRHPSLVQFVLSWEAL
jgi:hypothetical protein